MSKERRKIQEIKQQKRKDQFEERGNSSKYRLKKLQFGNPGIKNPKSPYHRGGKNANNKV